MKKFQFYASAIVMGVITFLFIYTFVLVFGGACELFDTSNIDLRVTTAFCIGFGFVGNRLAYKVREFYDKAFEK